ncbi:MAG TPA: S8 family serine peptidase [Nitrososphaeraceae archaeon]|nr:S8 family serine peptidase [Nitrososphaeraceae archaeon]
MQAETLGAIGILVVMILSIISDSVYGSIGESDIEITIVDPPFPPDVVPSSPSSPSTGELTPISETEIINTDVGGVKIPFQFIVVLEDSIAENASATESSFQALTVIVENLGGEVIYTYNSTIVGFAFKSPNQQTNNQIINALEQDRRVKFVEQDQTVVPFGIADRKDMTPFEDIPTGLKRVGADGLYTNTAIGPFSVDADIAIIDSGIDLDHQDLNVYRAATSIVPRNPSSQSSSALSSSNDTYLYNVNIEPERAGVYPRDKITTFYPPFSNNATSSADDECGHGTHVAGVAAAKHNSFGVVGVAPGARLWAIKVLELNEDTGKCEGALSSIIEAVDYVTENADEIDAANLSLGCNCNSAALSEAIDKSIARNVTYVVAAGNVNADASSFSPSNHTGVITVSAITDGDGKCGSRSEPLYVGTENVTGYYSDDSFALFSNYGSPIDIAAPGVRINSTYKDNSYALMGGTSIAAPHVTGAVALYTMMNQHLSVHDIRKILQETALTRATVGCDGFSRGYFNEDIDPDPEPLLHTFNITRPIMTDLMTYNNSGTIVLNVTGYGSSQKANLPADVVFTIDSSGSMAGNDPYNLRTTAVKSFMDLLNSTTDQAGIVSWDEGIDFTSGLSFNKSELKSMADNIDAEGSTSLDAGLNEAISVLDRNTRVQPSNEVIIFITDGNGTYTPSGYIGSPVDNANNKDYTIFSIGLNISSENELENTLRNISSSTGGQYFSSPSAENLQEIFNTIFRTVTTLAPSDVHIREILQNYVILDESSFNIRPTRITNMDDGRTLIEWDNITKMFGNKDDNLESDETASIKFSFQISRAGEHLPIGNNTESSVDYLDNNNGTAQLVEIPKVLINAYEPLKEFIVSANNLEIAKSAESLQNLTQLLVTKEVDPNMIIITN